MRKRAASLVLAIAVLCTLLWGLPLTAAAADRYKIKNPRIATGADIITEARKWAGTGAIYRSGVEPWEESVKWRTGYASDGQVSFDCSGFVGRILNDCGFRASGYTPPYGINILYKTYKTGYIGISIEELVNYGTDISAAIAKAKTGDYSDLQPGDVIGWTGGTLGRHVIFYAGLQNGVPWMVEMTGRGVLDRAVTEEYQAHFQYGARFAELPGENMLAQSTYPAYCEVLPAGNALQIMSLPCTPETDGDSVLLRTVNVRLPLKATALVRNSKNELWYKVKTASGEWGYVFAGDTEYLEQLHSDLYASGITVPACHTQGKTYSLTGKIISAYNQLTEVAFYVYDREGDMVTPQIGAKTATTGNLYTLGGSYLDKYTSFGKLAAGNYTCVVSGTYSSYYAETSDTIGINTGTEILYKAEFTVAETPTECSHLYTYTVASHPDCHSNGVGVYSCQLCGNCYTETIFAEEHSFVGEKIPATPQEGEKICYTCKNCGETHCQYTGVLYLKGDTDTNGVLNVNDVIELLLHVSMPNLFPMEPEMADLDGDGLATTADAILLLLHITMPDMYPIT